MSNPSVYDRRKVKRLQGTQKEILFDLPLQLAGGDQRLERIQ